MLTSTVSLSTLLNGSVIFIDFLRPKFSQCRVMEPCCTASWTTWNWKDITMPCSSSKTVNTPFRPVSTAESVTASSLNMRELCRYPHSRLIEINSHSLFSRWFSESGKLVQRLFSTVTDMVDDEDTFVVVLIGTVSFHTSRCNNLTEILDEVESLTSARAGAMAGTEPSDALRVGLNFNRSRILLSEKQSCRW